VNRQTQPEESAIENIRLRGKRTCFRDQPTKAGPRSAQPIPASAQAANRRSRGMIETERSRMSPPWASGERRCRADCLAN